MRKITENIEHNRNSVTASEFTQSLVPWLMGCPCRSADKRAVLSPALVVLPQALLTAGWWPPNSPGKCSKGKGKPQLPTAVTCSCSHWFPVHKWEMTSDELCARDLIKLNAAPDRKDYSDVRFLRKRGTKVWAVPLSVESDSIGLPEKLLKVKIPVWCNLFTLSLWLFKFWVWCCICLDRAIWLTSGISNL